ncbi:zinc-finger domain-containing protein [Minwuia sp.]|uniref:zinc-finger domain-containing protein n=1 Tax=Minwuia sp. TaxID=2493630 RepID=UPI003A9448F3
MAAAETIETTDHRVSCDGGGGALGHPTVYLEMGSKDHVDCPYCGRRFVRRTAGQPGGH